MQQPKGEDKFFEAQSRTSFIFFQQVGMEFQLWTSLFLLLLATAAQAQDESSLAPSNRQGKCKRKLLLYLYPLKYLKIIFKLRFSKL